jgi:hypothetical protein
VKAPYTKAKEEQEMRDTEHATELASAEHGEKRIERLYVKADRHEAIRFSWWKDGQFTPRPMGITEHELLVLLEKAIDNGVFSSDFLQDLLKLLPNLLRSKPPLGAVLSRSPSRPIPCRQPPRARSHDGQAWLFCLPLAVRHGPNPTLVLAPPRPIDRNRPMLGWACRARRRPTLT